MVLIYTFNHSPDHVISWLMIRLNADKVILTGVRLRHFLVVNVALFISEKICNQILASNASVANASQNEASHLEFWFRDIFHCLKGNFVYRVEVEKVFLKRSVGEAGHGDFLFGNLHLLCRLRQHFDIFSILLHLSRLARCDPLLFLGTAFILFQSLQSGCQDGRLVEQETILLGQIIDSLLPGPLKALIRCLRPILHCSCIVDYNHKFAYTRLNS